MAKKSRLSVDWRRKRFQRQKFVLAGAFPTPFDRAHAVKVIEGEGGQIVKSVTAAVDYLLVAEPTGQELGPEPGRFTRHPGTS